MPSAAACLSLEPAPGPATTRSVFADTEPAALAPSRSACALASSRLIVSSLPVNTTVLPATALSCVSTTKSGGETSDNRSSQTWTLCGSWKKSPSASTTTGPTPSIASSSARASLATLPSPSASWPCARSATSRSAGSVTKRFIRSRAVTTPTWRMPRPNSSRAASGRRLASIAANRLSTDLSFQPSRPTSSARRRRRRKMSAGLSSQPRPKNSAMLFSPSPSISSAARLTKWRSRSVRCAGQISPPVQRTSTSPSSATASLWHSGQ